MPLADFIGMLYGNWFVGFPVSPDGWYTELRTQLPNGLRVFHPEDLHLTVAFLGRLGEEARNQIREVLLSFTIAPLMATLGSLVPLPSFRRFSALSFELEEGRKEIETLMSEKGPPVFDAAGVEPDTRPPLAHVTIARPERKGSFQAKAALLEQVRELRPLPIKIPIDSIALYGWNPDRKGGKVERQFQIDTLVRFH